MKPPNSEYDTDELAVSPSTVFRRMRRAAAKFFSWSRQRILHKLQHLKPSNMLDILSKHGLALVVIIVGWEIIEDVLFPVLFVLLGNHVHPAFYAGAPASLLLCFHWLAVPILWGIWMKVSNQQKHEEHEGDHGCC